MHSMTLALRPAATALCLLLAACGGGATPTVEREPVTTPAGPTFTAPAETFTPPPVRRTLPKVEAIDLAAGTSVDVSMLSPSAKPLLVWFWAPH